MAKVPKPQPVGTVTSAPCKSSSQQPGWAPPAIDDYTVAMARGVATWSRCDEQLGNRCIGRSPKACFQASSKRARLQSSIGWSWYIASARVPHGLARLWIALKARSLLSHDPTSRTLPLTTTRPPSSSFLRAALFCLLFSCLVVLDLRVSARPVRCLSSTYGCIS